MGQFNDFRSSSRESWKFNYLGKTLAPFAKKKYDSYCEQETKARLLMSDLLRDATIKASDPKIEDLKNDIEQYGTEREKCLVWKHEFERSPDVSYSLSLGDVTYFDIMLPLS
jgi:hypothetical protein